MLVVEKSTQEKNLIHRISEDELLDEVLSLREKNTKLQKELSSAKQQLEYHSNRYQQQIMDLKVRCAILKNPKILRFDD